VLLFFWRHGREEDADSHPPARHPGRGQCPAAVLAGRLPACLGGRWPRSPPRPRSEGGQAAVAQRAQVRLLLHLREAGSAQPGEFLFFAPVVIIRSASPGQNVPQKTFSVHSVFLFSLAS